VLARLLQSDHPAEGTQHCSGRPGVRSPHAGPIYPNRLIGWTRYIVLNSGFTFREYDYLNNARQTPKLPDWAVVDITLPATSRAPGRIAAAGFFDERWT
jgi:hypothetical protein